MRFQPKTEDEIASENLLPAGEYDFEVAAASDEVSKSGNDMIKLKLRIFHQESERIIFDYLLDSVAYKLRHFCDTAGLIKEYESGALSASMCDGKAGRLNLIVQKDKTGQYSDKNSVKDYVVATPVSMPRSARAAASAVPDFPSSNDMDGIPF